MKLILIKIGKAIKILQREGFINGGQRILNAFLALFGRVKAGDILFITGGVGDSARYRTAHVAEELENQGFTCSITIQDNPFLPTYADKFKIFIFHRVLFTPSVKKLIEKIKAQNKEIIFETDDLVFDPKYLEHMDYFKIMNSLEKKLYENGVGGEILQDPYVKVCTTTTEYLAEKLREYPARNASPASNASHGDADWQRDAGGGKQVFLVPNKLSLEDLRVVEEIEKNKSQISNLKSQISLGYFSGTISHNKDFATITEALTIIMEKYPKVELFLAGPLDVESQLNKFGGRIKQISYAPRKKHFENISKIDINLAPLEVGNPFCESKSELKFFEAGILKIPTVASATETFKMAISDGFDGFVAFDTTEWVNKLEKLILSPEMRSQMGSEARKKVLEKYTTQNAKNEEHYAYLKSKL